MSESTRGIVERVLAGELDQYREIIRLFESDKFHVAAPLLGSRSAAEDAVQEGFISAYPLLDRFDVEQPFRPWLMAVGRNMVSRIGAMLKTRRLFHWNSREPMPSDPDKLTAAVRRAFEAGADGVLASREYDEMRMSSLEAFAKGIRT